MIWGDVCDSLNGAIRATCPTRAMTGALLFDVPHRFGAPLLASGADTRDAEAVRSWLVGIARDLADAHPFAYENMPLEHKDDRIVYPCCDPDEFAFFNEGLVPMPYPLSWFEYQGQGGQSGLLVKETGDLIELVEFTRTTFNGKVFVRVYPWVQQLYRGGPASLPEGAICVHHTKESLRPDRETRLTKGLLDPLGLYEREKAFEAAATGLDAGSFEADMLMQRESGFLVYLLVMLGSRSTETETTPPPKFANRKRREKGLLPLPSVTTVRVVPRWMADRIRAEGGDIHASPRMHWRRSHLRVYATGLRIVIPRHLVGFKALDGSELMQDVLKHRYRVSPAGLAAPAA